MFANGQGDHIYGLDVTPTIQTIDTDSDGKIEPSDGDQVIAYIAARRGGDNIYALDLTPSTEITSSGDTLTPRFLWRIDGGTGDFSRLGQTWSQPIITTINVDSVEKEVLIFGGGYDPALDNPETYSPTDNGDNDFLGNAIYIVDPEDGSLILSISGSGSGADIEVSSMNYSIVSTIRKHDSDANNVTDRLYAVDTGGQVWRVDLAALDTASTNPESTTVVGRLAEIADSSTDSKQRRFFNAPSVVQVSDTLFSNESDYDYVLIGSGYRPHPLNTDVEDRFYAFRDFFIGANSMQDTDTDGDNVSDTGYPQADSSAYDNDDLIDVTSTILDSSDSTHKDAGGWYFDFTDAGTTAEKVLSSPITVSGVVTFTTFSPESSSSDLCGAELGLGKAYNFDILSTGAALDFDGDGDIDLDDRSFELSGGIPSSVVPIFTPDGVYGVVGVEGGSKTLGKLADLDPQRSHWYENTEF
jgi:type IV pilus assembly protein PilY1